MNKSVVVLLLFGFLYAGCNRENLIKISGKVENSTDESIVFEEINLSNTAKIDSIKLPQNGKFKFKTHSGFPKFYQLRNSLDQRILVIAKPGDDIYIKTNQENFETAYEVDGSLESKKVQALQKRLNESNVKLDSLNTIYKEIRSSDTANVWYQKSFEQLQKEHKMFIIGLLLADPSSLSNIVGLYHTLGGEYVFTSHHDLQYFKIARDTLTKYYPRTKQVISLQTDVNRLLDKYNRYRLLNSVKVVEKGIPDIKLPDMKNDSISLSSLKGKYVLLNFWASLDKNSVQHNIQLKDLYSEFKKYDFEIYNVSLDKNNETWKRAVRFDQLPWINVNDTSSFVSVNARYYNVKPPLPVSYLIDKSQEDILGKNLSIRDLRIKLENLFY